MGRWVGVDHGTRRIGLAISDPDESLASPAAVLTSAGSHERDAAEVLAWAAEHQGQGLVVGFPLNMDGSVGSQAELTRRFVDQLRDQGRLPVETWDERLSSFQADEWLRAGSVKGARRKARRDALAAAVILQSFLDARRRTGAGEHAPPPGA